MAKWVATVNISGSWKKARSKEITTQQLCEQIIPAFKKLPMFVEDADLQAYVQNLQDIADADQSDDCDVLINEFDNCWDDIYDWADINRVWINI